MNEANDRLDPLRIALAIADGDVPPPPEGVDGEPGILTALAAIGEIAKIQRALQKSDDVVPVLRDRWLHMRIIGRKTIRSGVTECLAAGLDSNPVLLRLVGPIEGRIDHVELVISTLRQATRIHHPGLRRVLGVDYADGLIGVWSEAPPSETLREIVVNHGALSESTMRAIGQEVCAALSALHEHGLTHGEVSADSVIREKGRFLLRASVWTPKLATLVADAPPGLSTPFVDVKATVELLSWLGSASGSTQEHPWLRKARDLVGSRKNVEEVKASDLARVLVEGGRHIPFGWDWLVGFVLAAALIALMMLLAR